MRLSFREFLGCLGFVILPLLGSPVFGTEFIPRTVETYYHDEDGPPRLGSTGDGTALSALDHHPDGQEILAEIRRLADAKNRRPVCAPESGEPIVFNGVIRLHFYRRNDGGMPPFVLTRIEFGFFEAPGTNVAFYNGYLDGTVFTWKLYEGKVKWDQSQDPCLIELSKNQRN